MKQSKPPLSVILISAYLLLSIISIKTVLSSDLSFINTLWSPQITKGISIVSLLLNVLIGIGLLLKKEIARKVFTYSYPVFLLVGLINSKFQFISVTLFSIIIYLVAVYFLHKNNVNEYFTVSTAIPTNGEQTIKSNNNASETVSVIKKLLSLFVLFIASVFIYVSFITSYLMATEGPIGAIIVLIVLLSICALICYVGVRLWDRNKAFIITGSTIIASGLFSVFIGLIMIELSSTQLISVQQLDPQVASEMGRGSLVIGSLIAIIGGVIIYYQKSSASAD